MRSLLNRGRVWVMVMATGGLFALDSCDATVRDTVLTGVGSAATSLAGTFIQAFIESLQSEDEETPTTVQKTVQMVPQFFA